MLPKCSWRFTCSPDSEDRSERNILCHLTEVIREGLGREVVRYHHKHCCREGDLPLS
jgi:hypothetical protein